MQRKKDHMMANEAEFAENALRVDLAAAFRLAAMFGWDDAIFTHMSVRIGETDTFLINPLDLMFEEVTASSLLKIDLEGHKIGDQKGVVNPAGFVIHSAIHAARHDARAVIHLHTPAGQAVSAMKCGLLPYTQTAMIASAGGIGYHSFEGIATRDDEKKRIVADLGNSAVMIFRNHGTLATGASVADAFSRIYALERACQAQCLMSVGSLDDLLAPPPGAAEQVIEDLRAFSGAGSMLWQAWLRKLDRLDTGFRS
ncbi:class II aldolase/adducin family protein [Sphingobium sp. B11D3D]|uniref:class II aldolase/adducin family protein n=1 Tax=Sphingobium sp. B11D3D TaxID=2940576 RepID=UPI002224D40E|nr:class II aldolase/adducin family protein [Sphingobium sp. B11D3D]